MARTKTSSWAPPPDAKSRKAMAPILKLLFAPGRSRFLLSTHGRGDGDGLGCELALARALERRGKSADIVNTGPVPREYAFLRGADRIDGGVQALRPPYRAAIVMDAASVDRLEELGPAIPKECPIVNIDHHATNTRFGAVNWVDSRYSAVGEMLYCLLRAAEIPIDAAIAESLYVSILTDTGRFSFSNTTPLTHAIAADLIERGVDVAGMHEKVYRGKSREEMRLLGRFLETMRASSDGALAWSRLTLADMAAAGGDVYETQAYIDGLKSIGGVRVALLFKETEGVRTKLSIRADRSFDATQLAGRFGGGGHPRASGATIAGKLDEVERQVVAEAEKMLAETTTRKLRKQPALERRL